MPLFKFVYKSTNLTEFNSQILRPSLVYKTCIKSHWITPNTMRIYVPWEDCPKARFEMNIDK